MGSMDCSDVRTFKANFTAEGVTVLREKLNEKLKELMGNYTDETLVDYVIVLLRNGRGKDHAKNKLNVFLGEDSDSFVSWLWDHLALNIDLYVESKGLQDEAPKSKHISKVQAGDDGLQNLKSKSERVKSRSRRNRDWKGLVCREAEAPPLQSFVVDSMHLEKKVQSKVNRAPRPRPPSHAPPVQRKRRRAFEDQKIKRLAYQVHWKRDSVSQITVEAPRRLLQFAVRDALATSGPSNLGPSVEPSLKRLRSVVSSSSVESSMVEHPHRMQTISRMANPMAALVKAMEEAAEDVVKLKSPGSVFDRIGCDMYSSYDNMQLEDNQYQVQSPLLYHKERDYGDQYAANMTMLEHETGFSSNSSSDNEGFDDVNFTDNRVGRVSQLSSSGGKRGEDSLMVHYDVAKNDNNRMLLKNNRNQEQSADAPNTSKIVNISVNVNAWNPPVSAQYQKPREVAEISGYKILNSRNGAPRSGLRIVNENAKTLKIDNGKVKPTLNLLKETQKAQPSTPGTGSSAASCPLFDADSRTIFTSNVHFAATKDAICRHFNKFGEVLKTVIVTDSITGQPKGAAYVEFMHKEAADSALSLDGTSFMSRILKVVRKSTAQHQDYAPAVPWPRGVKGPSYPSASFPRSPIPTSIPGAFRPRPPIKFGARSLQWKRGVQGTSSNNGATRDVQGTSSNNGATFNNSSISPPVSRGLTYVRAESKLNGSVSAR